MNLFLADINKSFEDLFKAGRTGRGPRTGSAGGPRTGTPGGGPRTGTGGGPRTGTGGGPRTGAGGGVKLPSTPGAVSGGGKQIVDCPLGAACPDGGRHEMGSARHREHIQLSMKQKQLGTKPDYESKGQAVEKPGVQPGSQNIGSIGSDQVNKPASDTVEMQLSPQEKRLRRNERNAAKTKETPAPDFDVTQEMKLTPQERQLRRNESRAADTKQMPALYISDTEEVPSFASADTINVQTSDIRQPTPVGEAAVRQMRQMRVRPGEGELPDTADTLINMPVLAEVDARGENPAEERQTIVMQAQKPPHKRRQVVPNPMDPSTAPADSKPMDHYRLAQVARSSGDEETARAQEELAKQRANKLSSEEHKKLAEQLRKEGFIEAAKYHESINTRVAQYKNMRAEQEAKAASDFETAQKKHAETSAKAREMADKARATGKKVSKEDKAEPELKKPSTDGERLTHENHTQKASRVRDIIESHLVNNPDISPEDKRRLERAYKMAAYHAKIDYIPTATQRSELSEVERAMRDIGIKESWDDIQSKQQAKAEAQAAKQQTKQPATKPEPRAPQTPIEEAKVNAHRARARKLKRNLESHANNPDLGDDEKALIDNLLQALEDHENAENVPDRELDSALKELDKLSGDLGKKPYQPAEEGGGVAAGRDSTPRRDTLGYLVSQFHSGRAAGSALAASATSPYGAAGNISPQLAGYGLRGATSAGHRLLQRVRDGKATQEKLDKQKEQQQKESEKQEKAAERSDRPELKGLTGGTG